MPIYNLSPRCPEGTSKAAIAAPHQLAGGIIMYLAGRNVSLLRSVSNRNLAANGGPGRKFAARAITRPAA